MAARAQAGLQYSIELGLPHASPNFSALTDSLETIAKSEVFDVAPC
jgi:hypothetical protein